MSCLGTLKGINSSCEGNIGGIQRIFVADFDLIAVSADTGYTTITNVSGATGAKFYTYVLENEVGSATSTLTKGSGGVHYYTHEINVQFSKMDPEKSLELQAISKGQVAAVTLDNNGKYWYYGFDRYLSGEDTVAQSGQGFDDLNGYTSVLRGRSGYMPLAIEGDALTAFKALIEAAPVEASN